MPEPEPGPGGRQTGHGRTRRPPPAGAGSVVNRCGGGWSAVADAPSTPRPEAPGTVTVGTRGRRRAGPPPAKPERRGTTGWVGAERRPSTVDGMLARLALATTHGRSPPTPPRSVSRLPSRSTRHRRPSVHSTSDASLSAMFAPGRRYHERGIP